jgi:hypothetical protein
MKRKRRAPRNEGLAVERALDDLARNGAELLEVVGGRKSGVALEEFEKRIKTEVLEVNGRAPL